jgi:hypothetical protein
MLSPLHCRSFSLCSTFCIWRLLTPSSVTACRFQGRSRHWWFMSRSTPTCPTILFSPFCFVSTA